AERDGAGKKERESDVTNCDHSTVVVVQTCRPDVEAGQSRARSNQDWEAETPPDLGDRVADLTLRDRHEGAEKQSVSTRERHAIDQLRDAMLDATRFAREPPLEEVEVLALEGEPRPEEHREENKNQNRRDQPPARDDERHDRPHEVKLLLDRERPE